MTRQILLLLSLLANGIWPAFAQIPVLVDDIRAGSASSNPRNFINYNGMPHFFADDGSHGVELWVYNFGKPKPALVSDANPGGAQGALTLNGLSDVSVVYNGKLYFRGSTGSATTMTDKILLYDGSNPVSLAPGMSGYPYSAFGDPVVLGNKLYYIGMENRSSGTVDCLFSYDGINTPVLIAPTNITSIGVHRTGNFVSHIAAFKGKLYFSYDSSNLNNHELYSYDPAGNSVNIVADILPGRASSVPAMFMVAGNKLFFAAADSVGYQIYTYDGNILKRLTRPVPGLYQAVSSGGEENMAFYKGALYFEGGVSVNHTALFKCDTATGAVTLVKDIYPNNQPQIGMLYATPNNLYFFAKTAATGFELWRCDGTACAMVADLSPGKPDGTGISNFVLSQGMLYFNGNNGATGDELYRLQDIPSGSGGTGISSVLWTGQAMIFPNPARTSATLSVTLQSPQAIRIALTDGEGREVWTTGLQAFAAGGHEVNVPAQSLAAGQYFYHLKDSGGRVLASGALLKE